MDISFVIVNYNLDVEVKACVSSILTILNNKNYEIIIVDNNSPNGKFSELASEYSNNSKIKTLPLAENLGFGAGNNAGARIAKGKILFFLNPDATLISDFSDNVIKLFEERSDVGALGMKVIQSDTDSFGVGFFPSMLSEFLEIFLLRNIYEKNKLKQLPKTSLEVVDWVTGAAIIIPSATFNKIGGFDENIFLYNEEVDLCWRLKKISLITVYSGQWSVNHIGSVSSKKDYYRFTVNSYTSRRYLLSKHFNGFGRIVILFFFYMQIIMQLGIWLLMLPIAKNKSIGKIKGFFHLLFYFGRS